MALFSVMAFTIVTYIIIVFMTAFQCVPVRAVWDWDIRDKKCLNISNVAWSSAAVNIAAEVFILILPLPMLVPLRLTRKKKIGLYALFGAGVLTVAVAAARIPTLKYLSTPNDASWDNVAAYLWTCAETTVVNICAAAPPIRSLFTHAKNTSYASRYGGASSISGHNPSSTLGGGLSIPMTSTFGSMKKPVHVAAEKVIPDDEELGGGGMGAINATRPLSAIEDPYPLSHDDNNNVGFPSRSYTTTTITSNNEPPVSSAKKRWDWPIRSPSPAVQSFSRRDSSSRARARTQSPSPSQARLTTSTPVQEMGPGLTSYESGDGSSSQESVLASLQHPPASARSSIVIMGASTSTAEVPGTSPSSAAAAAAGGGDGSSRGQTFLNIDD